MLHPAPLLLPDPLPSRQAKTPAKRKAKRQVSNSTRCKLYRDQKQQYEDALVVKISALKEELATLQRGLWQEKTLLLRHVSMGSLDKLVREYFARIEYGLGSIESSPLDGLASNQRRLIEQTNDRACSQEAFLRHMMDSQVAVGPMKGVNALLAILRGKTSAFANSRLVLSSLKVVGSEESPVVVAWSVTHAILTRESLRIFFPGPTTDHELIHKYLHTPVAMESITTFHFTHDGSVKRVATENSYITSLIKSGWSVSDAARVLPHVQIVKAFLKNQAALYSPVARHTPTSFTVNARPSHSSRDKLDGLICEFCALFGIERDNTSQPPLTADEKAKEAFLRRVLDENVECGTVAGVDAVIRSWLHWADILGAVRKQVMSLSVAGDENEPILIVHLKNEFSGLLLGSLVPQTSFSKLELLNTDLCCNSKAQFHFTHEARVSLCSFDSGLAEALGVAGLGLEEICNVLEWIRTLDEASPVNLSDSVIKFNPATVSDTPVNILSKRAPKSSSERGQAFRLREKKREENLQVSLQTLRANVSQLETRLSELQQHADYSSPRPVW